MELQKDNDNEVSHFRTTKDVPFPVSDCNESKDPVSEEAETQQVISRHIPDNPYKYSNQYHSDGREKQGTERFSH